MKRARVEQDPSLPKEACVEGWGLSAQHIDHIFQHSPEMACFMQLGGNLVRVNSCWTKTLGWEAEELTKGPYIRFIHPDDVPKTLQYEESFIPTGFYNRWVCKDGSYRFLSWMGLSRIGSDIMPTFSIVKDVTLEVLLAESNENQIKMLNEQVQFNTSVAKAVLKIQRLFLRPIADGIPSSFKPLLDHFIALTESKGGFLAEDTSPATIHNLLQSLPEEVGSAVQPSEVEHIIDEAGSTSQAVVSSSLESPLVALPLLIEGELVATLVLVGRLRGYPPHLIEWLEPLMMLSAQILRDMALLKQKIASDAAVSQATDANIAKSAFLAHMSHELRTPLSGMIGLLDLINKAELSEEARAYIVLIEETSKTLLHILNDVLDLAKVEANQLLLEEVEFNPRDVIYGIIQLLSMQKKSTRLVLNMDPSIPSLLCGDPTRFRQILLNLVGNAMKFTDSGVVTVSIQSSVSKEDTFAITGEVRLQGTIEDTGIGMDDKTVAGIFNAFVQGDMSTSRKYGGTGLGLFLSKQLCSLMGGQINASSQLGVGSIFEFTVLLRTSPGVSHGVGSTKEKRLLPPLRVLVADDNGVNRIILKSMMQRNGSSLVHFAMNGKEAVEMFQSGTYDLVLMDLRMPIMDGYEATRTIRQANSTVPIIGVSAHAMKGDFEAAMVCGMNDYITKPVDEQELVQKVGQLLGNQPPPHSAK